MPRFGNLAIPIALLIGTLWERRNAGAEALATRLLK
jgi:hypothetical protein